MIGQTVSHYRILSKLGEGGMGVVYVAEDTLLRRRVAFKSLHVSAEPGQRHFRARFLREARAVSALSHPHIAAVHDYGETEEGSPYIVMELVEGQNLSDLLRQSGASVERAVEIVEGVAAALAEAHRHGIIHRDIKPSNIAVDKRGQVKVLDFGLAKQVSTEAPTIEGGACVPPPSATLTRDGIIVGTPTYLSPEQALGLPVDVRSDIFSLGLLLYECLTGKPPFAGSNVVEICAQIIRDDPPPPSRINPHVPSELDRITLKALAKKPDARYQTADELLETLKAVRRSPSGEIVRGRARRFKSFAARIWSRTPMPRVSASARLLLTVCVIALVVIAGWFVLRRGSPHEPPPEARQWYESGVNALRDGSYFKASKLLERAVQADDRFLLAHARLAEAWAELDYEDRATGEMLRVTELMPDPSALSPLDVLHIQAITATVRRNYVGAVDGYREIVKRLPEAEKTYAYFDLGRALEKTEDVGGAIEAFEELTRRDAQSAAAFLRLGILYGRKQDAAKADAAFETAQSLYTARSNYDGLMEVFYLRGYFLGTREKLPEAGEQLRRAHELAIATSNTAHQIKTLLQLSRLDYFAGNTERARRYADEAIGLARREQLDNLTMNGLLDIGNIFFVRGEYAEAEKYFTQVLEIAAAHKARRASAKASLSLGSLYVQQGKGADALRLIEPALAFYEQGNFRRETSQALLLLGYAHSSLGNYDEALRAYTRLLELARQANDTAQVAHARAAIGLLLLEQERFPEALASFEESYKLNKSLGLALKTGYDALNRGSLLWQLGRYAEARASIDEAAALARSPQGGDKQLLAWSHLSMAQSAMSELRYQEALAESRKASELAGGQVRDLAVYAAYTSGLAQARAGTARAGRASCQKAVEAAEQAGSEQLVSDARLALAEAALESGDGREALEQSLRAREVFARARRRHSEWRALLLAARASLQLGDGGRAREYATQAAALLTGLEREWGADSYGSYLTRRDVQDLRKRLDDLLQDKENDPAP